MVNQKFIHMHSFNVHFRNNGFFYGIKTVVETKSVFNLCPILLHELNPAHSSIVYFNVKLLITFNVSTILKPTYFSYKLKCGMFIT